MATPNDPRFFRDGTPRDGKLRNVNPLQTPSTAPRAVGAPTQGTVDLPFANGRTPTGRSNAELATAASSQLAEAKAGIARRALDDRAGNTPIPEGSVGYFVGSDGRKQTFTAESAAAKAAQLPTANTMPASAGGNNFAASNDARPAPVATAVYAPATSVPAAAPAGSTTQQQREAYFAGTPSQASTGMSNEAYQQALNAGTLNAPAEAPTAATSPNGAMPRRSMSEEFNSIRQGLTRPGTFDPGRATSSARNAATDVVRSGTDENNIVQMAANIASDPRLKGFPGARNAIIAGLIGQVGASSDAALAGQRIAGEAGISGQDFDQQLFGQETGRRGTQLRDDMLAQNDERLQRMRDDAAMERDVFGRDTQLQIAEIGANGRSRSQSSGDIKRADRFSESAALQFPDDQIARNLATVEAATNANIDNGDGNNPALALAGNEFNRALLDNANSEKLLGIGSGFDDWSVGSDGTSLPLATSDANDIRVLSGEENPWTVAAQQLVLPESLEPYAVEAGGARGVVRPWGMWGDAPSQSELRRMQSNQRITTDRVAADEAARKRAAERRANQERE